jgi:lysophospholipase L1-like esterase
VAVANGGSALTPDDLYDGVHPNATGYDKLGAAFYSALASYAARR